MRWSRPLPAGGRRCGRRMGLRVRRWRPQATVCHRRESPSSGCRSTRSVVGYTCDVTKVCLYKSSSYGHDNRRGEF